MRYGRFLIHYYIRQVCGLCAKYIMTSFLNKITTKHNIKRLRNIFKMDLLRIRSGLKSVIIRCHIHIGWFFFLVLSILYAT